MNKILIPVLLYWCSSFSLSPYSAVNKSLNEVSIEIKSLNYYAGESPINFPVIVLNGNEEDFISIEFDIKSESYPNLAIVFRLCNKNWQPIQNQFLENRGKNMAYNLSLDYLPVSVNEANYHFKGKFPDSDGFITFPFSGKWMFYITQYEDTSKVFATGKFFVVEQIVDIKTKVTEEILSDPSLTLNQLGKTINLESKIKLSDDLFPNQLTQLEIIENWKIEYPYILLKETGNKDYYFDWDGNRDFSFVQKRIRPGNEYRKLDLAKISTYSGKNVKAHLDIIEQSRFYKLGSNDLNGSFILSDYKQSTSEYLNVEFSLKYPNDTKKNVYIVGGFNNWNPFLFKDKRFLLKESDGILKTSIELKRGKYDYQYVVCDINNEKLKDIDWYFLEGNFLETKNIYHIFAFYNDLNFGGYDRIIAFTKVRNR